LNLSDSKERAYWAREIAALAADGESTDIIWTRLDIARSEVEEIYRLPEFEKAMRKQGEDVWEAWSITRAEARGRASIVQKIIDRADDYYERLHQIAMNDNAKDVDTIKVLLEFLNTAKQLGADNTGERVELTPASIRLLNKGGEILSRHRVDHSITPHNDDAPNNE